VQGQLQRVGPGNDNDFVAVRHPSLRAAQHMARRMERDFDVADAEWFAVAKRLDGGVNRQSGA